jgi:hypothetical protein
MTTPFVDTKKNLGIQALYRNCAGQPYNTEKSWTRKRKFTVDPLLASSTQPFTLDPIYQHTSKQLVPDPLLTVDNTVTNTINREFKLDPMYNGQVRYEFTVDPMYVEVEE